LYKFLTKDCKDALQKINDEEVKPELSHELSSFIGKYGTHVVLECTHGYRMEKVERMKVTSDKKLQDFKADIMASVLGYAGIHAGYQHQQHKAGERTENSLGIKNIGSKEHMKEAIKGNGINFEKMMQYSSEGGDAGVISHDWNMMIAEMLLAENSPYMTAAKRLQYWTHVRINDLKAGWDEGLFATSYELIFVHNQKTKEKKKKTHDKSICVTIGGRTVVHQHPGNDTESCGHVTNVHSNEAKRVQISVLDNELELKEVLAKITVYRRVLRSKTFPDLPNLSNDENKCVGGLVMATEIDTSGVENPEGEWGLSDLKKYYKWDKQEEKKDEQVTQKEATGKKKDKQDETKKTLVKTL